MGRAKAAVRSQQLEAAQESCASSRGPQAILLAWLQCSELLTTLTRRACPSPCRFVPSAASKSKAQGQQRYVQNPANWGPKTRHGKPAKGPPDGKTKAQQKRQAEQQAAADGGAAGSAAAGAVDTEDLLASLYEQQAGGQQQQGQQEEAAAGQQQAASEEPGAKKQRVE